MAKHITDSVTGPNPTMEAVPIESSGAAQYEIAIKAEETVTRLQEHFGDIEWEIVRFRDEVTLFVPRERIVEVCAFCKSELGYNYLSDLTGNDWPDRNPRFEVIYHLYSMQHFTRFRLKVRVPEDDCTCPSVTSIWATSNWHEREVFDMFGVVFWGPSRFAAHFADRRMARPSLAARLRNRLGRTGIYRSQNQPRLCNGVIYSPQRRGDAERERINSHEKAQNAQKFIFASSVYFRGCSFPFLSASPRLWR